MHETQRKYDIDDQRLYKVSRDTGYSRICPYCSKRYDEKTSLINKERVLVMATCEPCAEKIRTTNRDRRFWGY